MKFSCQTCEDRVPGCHSGCEKYRQEKSRYKQMKDKQKTFVEADAYTIDRFQKCIAEKQKVKNRHIVVRRNNF
jgi:hypothetical protein